MHLFFDLTHFRELGQRYRNFFVSFLVQMKTFKSAFEINWPLGSILEPVCCKKQKQKVLDQLLVCGIGNLRRSEWYEVDPGWSGESLGQSVWNHQRSPILQTSNWSGIFFAVSYSKLALVGIGLSQRKLIENQRKNLTSNVQN